MDGYWVELSWERKERKGEGIEGEDRGGGGGDRGGGGGDIGERGEDREGITKEMWKQRQ